MSVLIFRKIKSVRLNGYTMFYWCAKPKSRIIMFSQLELRVIKNSLKDKLAQETVSLQKLGEDSDDYMEKANDLMVIDALISKVEQSLF